MLRHIFFGILGVRASTPEYCELKVGASALGLVSAHNSSRAVDVLPTRLVQDQSSVAYP